MKQLAIFDLDGTLANTLTSITYCMNRTLKEYGISGFSEDDYRYFVGNGASVLVKKALAAAGDAELSLYEEVFHTYTRNFAEDCMYQVKPYPGIPELLENLKKQGIKIAVLSNKPHANTVMVVETLFGKNYFDAVQGQTEEIPRKPDPAGIYHLEKLFSVSGKDVLYVGDSSVDMDTGKAAGVMTAGVLWGFRDKEELLAHGADVLVGRPEELLNCL